MGNVELEWPSYMYYIGFIFYIFCGGIKLKKTNIGFTTV
jgi:hypothetical protein